MSCRVKLAEHNFRRRVNFVDAPRAKRSLDHGVGPAATESLPHPSGIRPPEGMGVIGHMGQGGQLPALGPAQAQLMHALQGAATRPRLELPSNSQAYLFGRQVAGGLSAARPDSDGPAPQAWPTPQSGMAMGAGSGGSPVESHLALLRFASQHKTANAGGLDALLQALVPSLARAAAGNPAPPASAHTGAGPPPAAALPPPPRAEWAPAGTTSSTGSPAPDPPPIAPPAPASDPSPLLRVSIKLFDCEPQDLAPDVRSELEHLLAVAPQQMEAYVRPGCAHVTADICAGAGKGAALTTIEVAAAAQALLAALNPGSSEGGHDPGHEPSVCRRAAISRSPFLVQVGDQVAVGVGATGPVVVLEAGAWSAAAPELLKAAPACTIVGRNEAITLLGSRISGADALPLCRQHGRNVTLDILPGGAAGRRGDQLDVLEVRPLGLQPGWAEFEVEQEPFLSAAVPVLVLPDSAAGRAAAAELNEAASSPAGGMDRMLRGWYGSGLF